MAKVKFQTVVNELAREAFLKALFTAKPKLSGHSDSELAKCLSLTEYQYEHLLTKTLGKAFSEQIEEALFQKLKDGDSIEFPHKFNIFVHESEVRTNEDGNPAKKFSIRTRRAAKEKLN